MNALRQIAVPFNGQILVDIPKEYQQKRFEIIILPIEETSEQDIIQAKMNAFLNTLPTGKEVSEKDPQKLMMAHKIIDMGTTVSKDFITDFEQNKQDRSLPFRD